ncbi:uncharacterized protein SCHCODRAFT_02071747 [Schizophyllum commune H4-8]|uniref:uncharacterized protein n=1 Tax=Schizophyllum commune (strain H4-8 / FGSC 9210) TaxID=578458 RepID=UPI00215FEC08|nr:uncharacterized protein SCHCODRAFT_02071747 [Schizophyllum commune H4-8]KAI5887747.1 hypothetical protein SCHCODRAFT_02071747 [Schizophyllum commune H4-8]
MVPPSAESSFVSMRDGDTTRDRDGDTTIGSSAYASLSANISSSADASSSINADRTIGASSWGTSAGPVPELSLTTAEGDDPNASGSTLHPSSADYNAGPSPAFPEMSAATLPGTAGMALEVPSAGWAVYGGDPSRGVESGTRSRSTSRAGSMLQDALDSGTPPDPDAMDVDPPTYGAGPSMHGDSAAAQSTKRLIGVEPDFQGGINLVWATNDLTAPPPPLVLGTRPDDSLFNPVPPSLPGSLSIGPGPTPDAHASLIRAAFGISTTGVSRASASTAAGRTVIANRPARPPTLTRTPLRPRLAPRCALTRRLFHALSLALPADLAWRIYAQWAGKIFGGARGGFPAVSDAEDPAPDSSGLPRTESEFPALCAVFCATLGIPPPSKERADVPARVDAGLPRRASAFHALALSPSASRFREDPALRGLKRPGKVNAMPSVGPVGDAPRGPLQEVSMAEPEEVGPAVLASAMWALHMLFEGE